MTISHHARILAIFSLVLLVVPKNTLAQKQEILARNERTGEETRFTVLDQEIRNMNRLYVGAMILGMDVADGFFMGFGLDGHYRASDDLILNAGWFRPYAKGTDSEMGEYYDDRGDGLELRLYNRVEFGGTYYFSNRTRMKNVKMVLKESTNTRGDRVVHLLKTDVPSAQRYGLRGGYYYYQQSAGGTLNIAIDTLANGSPVNLTSFTNHSIYLGFNTSAFQHYILGAPDFGEPARSNWRSFYADLMIGLGGTAAFHAFSDEAKRNVPVDRPERFGMNRMGWRVGWERVNRSVTSKHFGLMMGAELGSRPAMDIPSYPGDEGFDKNIGKGFFSFRFALLYQK
jgi:hypothetical protein